MNKSEKNTVDILMICAEASSALYGKRILQEFQRRQWPVHTYGVGNSEMVELGFEALGRSEEMAVVGLQEVLAHYSDIKKVFNQIVDRARLQRPAVALLLDYPEFNMKLAAQLKKIGIPVVYYISPQIWAWRQYRVKKIKKLVDKMLVLFPFEKQFYEKHAVPVEFVGHPLLDELDSCIMDEAARQTLRARYGILPEEFVLGLMPGSRKSEIQHLLETQILSARKVIQQASHVRVVLCLAPGVEKQDIQSKLESYLDFPLTIIQREPFEMIQMTDAVLVASGTATMMVGLMQKPMVIVYKMNGFTAWLAKKLVTHTKYFGMINLILDEMACPEFFQEQAEPEILSQSILEYVKNSEYYQSVVEKLSQAQYRLGNKGVTKRVVDALQPYILDSSKGEPN